MQRAIAVIFVLTLGCAQFPELDRTIDEAARAAPIPELQPLGPLLAQADSAASNSQITPASVAALDDRIAGLRNRAADLRRPVIEPAIRARMRRGVAVPAAIR